MSTIRIADFFCGVGGIRLGVEQAIRATQSRPKKSQLSVASARARASGRSKIIPTARFTSQCVFSNDNDKHAKITYLVNFPDSSSHFSSESISDLDPETLPDFDLFLAGFPCQSFSVAG